MKRTIIILIALAAVAFLTTTVRAQNLVAKWANTTTITAANQTYVNGMGYNPNTGDLIVSMCAGAASATIYTFKSTDGTASSPATLSTTGLPTTGHTYMIGGLTVASDGTIYACSYNAASTQKIYSWANESATPTTLCTWAWVGPGSIGKNLSVYGTGNSAVFLLTGTSTSVIYVYYTGSAWAQKVVTVGSQSCQSDCAFVNWSSSSCQFITKNSSANGYSTTFNPSSGSPITASQTAITGFASGSGSIHNLAYDPITKLIGTYTRTATASPWAITANTWTAGYPSGTLTAPTAQTPISVNTSAVDTGNIGANCWGSGTWQGIYYCGPATTGGYGVRAYDTTAFKITDTSPAGPVVVTAGAAQQTFSVVSGGSELNYQWQVNTGSGYNSVSGSDFSGGTTATLTINPTTTADSGSYQCVVTQPSVTGGGTPWTSTPATLTVKPPCTPPSVGPVTPSSQTFCAGGSASFSVPDPTGTSPFTYQWQVDKGSGYANVSGSEYGATGTAQTLTINPLATADAGSYQCVVTGQCSPTATATAGTLTVNPLPTVSVNSTAICAGGSATLTATTSASSPAYLWNDPTSATTPSITVSPAATTTYTVTVTDGSTTCANSGNGTVTVNTPPTVTTDTTNQTACAGSQVTWSVVAAGAGLTYQWQRDGTNLLEGVDNFTGVTTVILTNSAVASPDGLDAAHGYACVISSGACSVPSTLASLTVNPLPTVSVNSATVCAGGSATLTATTSASSPAYLWNDPTSATTASITVSPASTTAYTVTVTDGVTTCANSGSGAVTVNPLPTVSVNSTAICPGGSATLTATTSASSPAYLWNDPTSATTASITVSPASTTAYTVTVTDGVTTCANSGSGAVTVNPLPTVSVNSTAICPGGSATLTATTSASSPAYLWNDPTSATTASITVSPAATTTYTVTVTDGSTTCANSGSGTVTVTTCGPVVQITNIVYNAGTATITGTGVVATATWFLKASGAINTPTPWTSINSGGPVDATSVITVTDPAAGSYSQRFYYLTNQ